MEFIGDPGRVLTRQHRGRSNDRSSQTSTDTGTDTGTGTGTGAAMASHRSGVAQAEVDVLDAVDVDEPCAGGVGDVHGKRTGPPGHPRHRHPGQQMAATRLGQLG